MNAGPFLSVIVRELATSGLLNERGKSYLNAGGISEVRGANRVPSRIFQVAFLVLISAKNCHEREVRSL